ncbi:hypothetical protein D3C85_1716980 [compost metagenome]
MFNRLSSMGSTMALKPSPAVVRAIPRARRSNRIAPRCSSSTLICLLTALWVRYSSLAARVKLPVRTTASKAIRVSSGGK